MQVGEAQVRRQVKVNKNVGKKYMETKKTIPREKVTERQKKNIKKTVTKQYKRRKNYIKK